MNKLCVMTLNESLRMLTPLQEIGVYVGMLAFLISCLNLWYNFLRKAKPKFVCSRWTAIGMQHSDGFPKAAFAVKISSINNGAKPLEVKDFLLTAKDKNKILFIYEPILLFDLRQWIEDGNKPDKFGWAQKGQIPLPFVVPPKETFDFEHHIFFLPADKATMIDPRVDGPVELRIFALTDRSSSYKLIGEQQFKHEDIKDIRMGSFSSILSDESTKVRAYFVKKLKW